MSGNSDEPNIFIKFFGGLLFLCILPVFPIFLAAFGLGPKNPVLAFGLSVPLFVLSSLPFLLGKTIHEITELDLIIFGTALVVAITFVIKGFVELAYSRKTNNK